MSDYSKPLDNKGWSNHYNMEIKKRVVDEIKYGNVSIWSAELIHICENSSKCLEIGCGSGVSSLWLAKNGRNVTALDYTQSSVELVKAAADELGLKNIDIVLSDATKDLPFEDHYFDYIFQAGLLEHFDQEEQVRLLLSWKRYGKYIISMIPNAASLPYRVGKQIQEINGIWKYGLEIPKHSFTEEFLKAGIEIVKEYTIGTEWALKFLPKKHYIREFFEKLKKDGYNLDEYMQGYLLVTIGKVE